MPGKYHRGELSVQKRAGVSDVGYSARPEVPASFAAFAATARMAVLASSDSAGRMWASLLTGEPGFATAVTGTDFRVLALPRQGDPGLENLRADQDVGLLVFDPSTRRRIRVNGRARVIDGGFDLRVHETFGNCRQYIQSREYLADGNGLPVAAKSGDQLTPAQQARLRNADTFFMATRAPGIGLDASHRGGRPGFLDVLDARALQFPDYPGNNFFNTLGNLELDPHAGLLFVDFENGDVLQLTGAARVIWNEAHRRPPDPGRPQPQRVVRFELEQALDAPHASPLRMKFLEYSPFNP
jgi:predicted pyridoxine 5'-phosphate oxidase superfamily flavin-nucleotide-binding protein